MEKRNDSFRWEDKVIEHKRFIKAPRSLVWEVWTKPEHLAKWYGPEGYTLTTAQLKLQTGGSWNFVMHGFGKDYQNDIRYTRIEPEHTLCFRNGAIDNPYGFDVQVTLEEQEGGTWLTMRSEFSSKAVIEELNQKVNAIEGGKQTLNKLVAYAEKLFSGS
ncbi:MAG TPA: SRPBCC domain-containing protein [Bacteroidia bacterium]|nr:SRPBCC domain-containing protein [Bacteroidia bacterium]